MIRVFVFLNVFFSILKPNLSSNLSWIGVSVRLFAFALQKIVSVVVNSTLSQLIVGFAF